jgi:stress-induced morphogen
MPTAEEIKQRIEATIPGAQAEVEDYTGGGDHFRATVVSPAFAGRSRIEQHKLVYGVFGDEIGGPIHALSLKTQAQGEPGVTAAGEQHAAPAAT